MAYEWRGRAPVAQHGDKVGTIVELYADEPEWAAVGIGLFGTKLSLVPIQNAEPSGWKTERLGTVTDDVKDRVKDAGEEGSSGASRSPRRRRRAPSTRHRTRASAGRGAWLERRQGQDAGGPGASLGGAEAPGHLGRRGTTVSYSRYRAYRRLRELLPGLGSELSIDELELLRKTAEDLLLTRPGQEDLAEEAIDRAAGILAMLVMCGRLPETHAVLLREGVAACGPERPLEGPLKLQ